MSTTPNMGLVLATPEVTTGPLWAQMINTAYGLIDLHDHTTGNGVKITPSGMDITSDLTMNSHALLAAIALGMSNQAAAVTSRTGSLQMVGGNLYYINSAGAAVQITSGSSVISTGSGVLSVSVPGAYPYDIVTGDAQAVLIVDSSAARTLNLPAATNAMTVYIKDGFGSASTNPITIAPDGTDTIDTVNDDFLINYDYGSVALISDGVSNWYVI